MDPVSIGLVGFGAYLWLKSRSRQFRYKKKCGSWRAYFKGTPPSLSHVLRDDDGYYVCWNRPLQSEQEARRVAKCWMDTYG